MSEQKLIEKIEKKSEIYKEELERLWEVNNGELKVEQVIESARSTKSPLHDYFDWEDSVAAKAWRFHQARLLFGYVKVDLKFVNKNIEKKVRIGIQVVNKNKQSVYVPMMTAIKTKSYAQQLIDEILVELDSLNNKLLLFKQNIK